MPAKGLAGRTKSEAARQRKDPMQNLKPFTKENAAEMGRKGGSRKPESPEKEKEAETMPGRNPRIGAKRKKQREADRHGIRR